MIQRIFTVFDSKADAYLVPFFQQSAGVALRIFEDLANDPEHQFFRHPEDFTLFSLGTYDDQNASFDLDKTPSPLAKAIEVKRELTHHLEQRS